MKRIPLYTKYFNNAVHKKFNSLRQRRTWKRFVKESGVCKSSIVRLLEGRVVNYDTFIRLCKWIERDPQDFLKEKKGTND